jgi:sporulation protein YlmC with PRC-barrel domain
MLALVAPLAVPVSAADRRTTAVSPRATESGTFIQLASDDTEGALQRLKRNEVRAANGESLGRLRDFVIDRRSGEIVYAVVGTGGFLGMGETLRLVPFQSLDRRAGADSVSLRDAQSEWDRFTVIQADDLRDGRFNVVTDREPPRAERRDVRGGADERRDLISAAKLRGHSVRAGTEEIGEVEDIVIDFERRMATALIETDSDFTGSEEKYLVPLDRLRIESGRDVFTTQLTRADFQDARRSTERVSATGRVSTTDRVSTPDRVSATGRASTTDRIQETDTGRTERRGQLSASEHPLPSATAEASGAIVRQPAVISDPSDNYSVPRRPAETSDRVTTERRETEVRAERQPAVEPTGRESRPIPEATLQSAARSISQLWETHPSLGRLGLRASHEDGRLVLSGTVPNKELWELAKDTAEGQVRGLPIDNRIRIESR